jgi:hypothetical protein
MTPQGLESSAHDAEAVYTKLSLTRSTGNATA